MLALRKGVVDLARLVDKAVEIPGHNPNSARKRNPVPAAAAAMKTAKATKEPLTNLVANGFSLSPTQGGPRRATSRLLRVSRARRSRTVAS